MSDINMSELIKVAKAQQMEKDQAKTQKVKNKVVVTNVQSYEHGGYVTTDDGSGAIVIDNDHELRKMQENDVTGKTLLNLIHHNGLIVDANAYVPDYGDNAPENYDPGVEYINNNPYDQKAMDMKKIKQQFASLTYGPEGLVNVNDPKGKLVTEALEKLRSGEIVLPSPEEYKEQKRIAKEKREKNNSVTVKRNQSSNDRPIELNDTKQKEIEELVMPSVPENAVMKKGVLEQLNEMNLRGTKPSVPVTVKHTKQPEGVPTPNPIEHTEPIKNTPPQQKAPINLAEMEEIVNNNEVSTEQATPTPEEKSDVAVFNVPEGQVSDFMKTLPMETFNKVASSKVIQVNEVELKDVPTASRRITSIAEYRRLSQHRANNKTVEITERVLVNSGFVVTLKAATSLEMATIFKNPMSEEVDWEKSYRFCYEHTVDTSIGRLSFNEYVMKVSPSDIETVLNGIYELSETFERNISVSCGKRDGCGTSYEIKIKVSDLPDIDDVDNETKERIAKIISVKGDIAAAKDLQMSSPTTFVKYVEMGDRILAIRDTSGNMMIERMDRINMINDQYGALVAVLVLYVENITISIQERDDIPASTFIIDDLELICEELKQLTDEEVTLIKNIITNDITSFKPVTYSIKGPIVCPNCGHEEQRISCAISDLVFQRAQSVLM